MTSVPVLPRSAALALLAFSLSACAESPASSQVNQPPVVTIATPLASALFAGGDTIDVAVTATDPEQGELNGTAISWWVVLHHDDHVHPFFPLTQGNGGRVGVPRLGHPESSIFLRFYARAVDAGGLADTASVDVHPRLTTLTLASEPSGLQVTLDGQPRLTPYVETTVVGMEREVGVVSPQDRGLTRFLFLGWQDAATATRTLVTSTEPLTLTAVFDSVGPANAAPAVTLTAPAPGATVTVGVPVALSADASDADGTVVEVRFEVDGAVVGTSTSAPFGVEWTPNAPGTFRIAARAVDNEGASRRTEPIEVLAQASGGGDVIAPTVTLLSPLDGATGLLGAVMLEASATDNVGVSLVEFAVDDSTFASAVSPPYSATLPSTGDFTSGVHVLSARARDAAGNWSPWARATVRFGGNVTLPAGFSRSVYASGLGSTPTAMAFAPDGRLFVAEQGGALRVVVNGALLTTPFITVPTVAEGERGLLGVAFDPDYAATNWVYLYYTSSVGEPHNVLVRVTADGNTAVPGSTVTLVEFPTLPASGRHNGGAMQFGPDGKLYVAVGDATIPTAPPSLESPFGKMLRFERNGAIPTDNPFYAITTGLNRAIWARGLRNPYTFAIDPTTGRMHINDVGESTWEEINLGRAGADYGWPSTEGPTDAPGVDSPLFAYRHSASPTLFEGVAVVGAGFYPRDVVNFGPAYAGDYFFGDYGLGWIYRLDANAGWRAYAFAQLDAFITGLTIGPDGALYVLIENRVERLSR